MKAIYAVHRAYSSLPPLYCPNQRGEGGTEDSIGFHLYSDGVDSSVRNLLGWFTASVALPVIISLG